MEVKKNILTQDLNDERNRLIRLLPGYKERVLYLESKTYESKNHDAQLAIATEVLEDTYSRLFELDNILNFSSTVEK